MSRRHSFMVRAEHTGGHVTLTVWAGPEGQTRANVGMLTFSSIEQAHGFLSMMWPGAFSGDILGVHAEFELPAWTVEGGGVADLKVLRDGQQMELTHVGAITFLDDDDDGYNPENLMFVDTLEVLDPSGHLHLTWDPSKPSEVEKARIEIERLRVAGYAFFVAVAASGDDPLAGGQLQVHRTEDLFTTPTAIPAPLPTSTFKATAPKKTTSKKLPPEAGTLPKCAWKTAKGTACKKDAVAGSAYCKTTSHKGKAKPQKPKGKRGVAVPPMRGG